MQRVRFRRRSMWKGVAAGLAGGLAGSFAMTLFQRGWTAVSKKLQRTDEQQQQSQSGGGDSEDATMKAADKLYQAVAGQPLSKEEKKVAGPAVHYVFGTAMGGLYGAAVEYDRRASSGAGIPFGTALFATADELAVPALGLSKDPTEYPLSQHAYSLASHAVYGVTTEAVRKFSRELLRKL